MELTKQQRQNIEVCILSKQGESFVFLQTIALGRVPAAGEKIIIPEIAGDATTAYVHEVIDVHFANHGKVDVFTILRGTLPSYLGTLGATTSL